MENQIRCAGWSARAPPGVKQNRLATPMLRPPAVLFTPARPRATRRSAAPARPSRQPPTQSPLRNGGIEQPRPLLQRLCAPGASHNQRRCLGIFLKTRARASTAPDPPLQKLAAGTGRVSYAVPSIRNNPGHLPPLRFQLRRCFKIRNYTARPLRTPYFMFESMNWTSGGEEGLEVGPIAILLVEDNPKAARELREKMNCNCSDPISITLARSVEEAEQTLSEDRFDVILLDLDLPDGKGVKAIRKVRKVAPRTPVVVLSEVGDRGTCGQALSEGAYECLIKNQFDPPVLRRVLHDAIKRVIGFDAYF